MRSTTDKLTQIQPSVRISQMQAIDAEAKRRGVSASLVVREALDFYFAHASERESPQETKQLTIEHAMNSKAGPRSPRRAKK